MQRNPDIVLAQKLLGGWMPQVPLERGLGATIAILPWAERAAARVARNEGRPQVAASIGYRQPAQLRLQCL